MANGLVRGDVVWVKFYDYGYPPEIQPGTEVMVVLQEDVTRELLPESGVRWYTCQRVDYNIKSWTLHNGQLSWWVASSKEITRRVCIDGCAAHLILN